MSKLESSPSNPVSHASEEAEAEQDFKERLASLKRCIPYMLGDVGSIWPRDVEWLVKELESARSTLSSLRAEHYALKAERSNSATPTLAVERCAKRDDGGSSHCDHLTGGTLVGGQQIEEVYTCCYCNRDRKQDVKPQPRITGGGFRCARHGPFVPPIRVY